jgi:oligopeptidase B
LPLTVGEYEEWGNPEDPKVYQRILAYSPIDNVAAQSYPAVLATGGLNDPRVGYWEPAKWVLRLRENTTSDQPVLFRCEMAGHGGSTGRWDKYKESAEIMAFVVNQIELSH